MNIEELKSLALTLKEVCIVSQFRLVVPCDGGVIVAHAHGDQVDLWFEPRKSADLSL
jgi:hypothetical protein